ncbi:MAG: NFACT family protein [Candidatus Cloacimonetes bacterium]|nr:NFACT family protein [Candidatus Cloacimonadota bacterium]MBS3768204.1 NFACT family protein [Candidatus Cloacimonadota bacterium]
MPELPDVEYFKFYFKRTSLHKKIENVTCESKELLQNIDFEKFKKKLVGTQFQTATRRGKFLIIRVKELEEKLLLHFAMTGSLHYVKQGAEKEDEDRFTRLTFQFKNNYELRWRNMRKLGKIYLLENLQKIDLLNEMGPEPLDISKDEFMELIDSHPRQMIKSFLMSQSNLAGIGNVYSDEILYRAKIHPRTKIKNLSAKDKSKLHEKMQKVLRDAIEVMEKKDWNFSPDKWIIPHRHEDDNCPRYKSHKLVSKKVAGRTAIFCPKCQKFE